MNLVFNDIVKAGTAKIYDKLKYSIPDLEWPILAPYIFEINKIKKKNNFTILAHNYQTPDIFYGIADVVGDSLGLAIKGSKVKEKNILMCGVHFMAETAKIMSPEKKVFIPDMRAGCSLAESITAEDVRNLKKNIQVYLLLHTLIHQQMLNPKLIFVVHLQMLLKWLSL